ncbi:unnamed protein product, partial [Prunus brigantina]
SLPCVFPSPSVSLQHGQQLPRVAAAVTPDHRPRDQSRTDSDHPSYPTCLTPSPTAAGDRRILQKSCRILADFSKLRSPSFLNQIGRVRYSDHAYSAGSLGLSVGTQNRRQSIKLVSLLLLIKGRTLLVLWKQGLGRN